MITRWFIDTGFPPLIHLAQLSPIRHSKLSGAEHHICSCCALSKVTEFLQDGESWGEVAVL